MSGTLQHATGPIKRCTRHFTISQLCFGRNKSSFLSVLMRNAEGGESPLLRTASSRSRAHPDQSVENVRSTDHSTEQMPSREGPSSSHPGKQNPRSSFPLRLVGTPPSIAVTGLPPLHSFRSNVSDVPDVSRCLGSAKQSQIQAEPRDRGETRPATISWNPGSPCFLEVDLSLLPSHAHLDGKEQSTYLCRKSRPVCMNMRSLTTSSSILSSFDEQRDACA
ncbi:hypothetical protein N657DRAFT_467316 [Parathielavia appendiculata]|uniref:Uncharacterized protein n=1 Tax=Parathielavia appendiculata TaxID=2587402 RepID=A0AAN6TXM3_9PEZI|nr:hypothetical protein N657DRAFT_467316 [Parathielavia appendiculata]